MRAGISNGIVLLFLTAASSAPTRASVPSTGIVLEKRDSNNPLNIDWSPAPPPDEGPPLSAGALRNPKYLPAEIGGIVGSYAFSLVLVAIGLLALAKTRRDHLRGAEEADGEEPILEYPGAFLQPEDFEHYPQEQYPAGQDPPLKSPKSPVPNFSYPVSPIRIDTAPYPASPTRTEKVQYYFYPSPTSTVEPGVDLNVDQTIVAQDRIMAQQQLEDMYKYVMEQEAAKEAGVEYQGPQLAAPNLKSSSTSTLTKRERNKPSSLNLGGGSEKTQSRTSSILSALRSPRKKNVKGISISSPIMTPMSGTFPRMDGEEMNSIPPRQYAPAPPPPVPSGQAGVSLQRRNTGGSGSLPTPDISPQSTVSIDERIASVLPQSPGMMPPSSGMPMSPGMTPQMPLSPRTMPMSPGIMIPQSPRGRSSHTRDVSATSAVEPDSAVSAMSAVSAVSERSDAALVGLPTSPKPGVNRFPSLSSLPKSPVPGQSFPRMNAPSAVRTDGALPFRMYEPALTSPSATSHTTKQTVFERKQGPLSPGLRTPWTGAPVPYSPYQPFSPVIPITPSLVTKEDRKRMKRMVPKTPTMEMVKSNEDIW